VDLLILGGTRFLGRHLTEEALRRGYGVTLFHRGQTNAELFPEAERVLGDRAGDLAGLEGRAWDAVVDTSGYLPAHVRRSAEVLADAVGRYAFISTISVYEEWQGREIDEDAPLATIDDETAAGITAVEQITGETYGALKARCEEVVREVFGNRALIVRPGLIVGPHDPTDRFTYWPARIARGGEVLAPGDPSSEVQFVDARDLAEWTLDLVEAGATGTYNATGPAEPLTMGAFLDVTRQAVGGDAALTWVHDAFLQGQEVGPFVEMPLWIPGGDMRISIRRAREAGLTFRPLADTIRDTLAWDRTRGDEKGERRAGLSPEREQALLARWSAEREGA
jgi:2'-hydroxyisoflavone reductase